MEHQEILLLMGWQVADHLLADGEGHGNVEAEQEQHED